MKIKRAIVMFRHGARAPVRILDKIGNGKDDWPNGPGQLTNKGKMEQYRLGQFLRRRYPASVIGDYRSAWARSTAVDRTFQSAVLTLGSIYPPTGEVWNPNLLWQPVRILNVPLTHDKLIQVNCSVKGDEQSNNLVPPSGRFKNKSELITFIFKSLQETKILPKLLYSAVDQLICLEYEGLTVPQWAKDIWVDINWLSNTEFLRVLGVNFYVVRQVAGPFYEYLLEKFQSKELVANHHQKNFFLFALHDLNVYAALKILANTTVKRPLFSSTLLFDLLEDDSGKEFVQVLFLPDVYKSLENVTIEGYMNPYPMEKFEQIIKSRLPKKWGEECGIDNSNDRFI